MGTIDNFVNLVCGLRIDAPAADLSIISAIASSTLDKYIEKEIILCGEVGLTGEVRSISHLNHRITEAVSLGFKKAIVPSYGMKEKLKNVDIDLYPVKNVKETFKILLSDKYQEKASSLGFVPLQGEILIKARTAIERIKE